VTEDKALLMVTISSCPSKRCKLMDPDQQGGVHRIGMEGKGEEGDGHESEENSLAH
jgi:hypothetical protein